MKTITQIAQSAAEKRKQHTLNTKQQIQKMLGWNELRYNQFQMDRGYDWLAKYLVNDEYGIKHLTQSRMFWQWWINYWDQRDELFLSTIKTLDIEDIDVVFEYKIEHHPNNLHRKPHRAILEDSYSIMIQELIDESHKTNQL